MRRMRSITILNSHAFNDKETARIIFSPGFNEQGDAFALLAPDGETLAWSNFPRDLAKHAERVCGAYAVRHDYDLNLDPDK